MLFSHCLSLHCNSCQNEHLIKNFHRGLPNVQGMRPARLGRTSLSMAVQNKYRHIQHPFPLLTA